MSNPSSNANSKIMMTSFVLAGALIGFCVHLLIKAFAGAFGVVARATDSDLVRHGVPIAIGLAIFAFLQFNPRVRTWGDDVLLELKKVVYPSRKDTTAMTIVVVIMVIISSIIVSTFDMISGYVINVAMR